VEIQRRGDCERLIQVITGEQPGMMTHRCDIVYYMLLIHNALTDLPCRRHSNGAAMTLLIVE